MLQGHQALARLVQPALHDVLLVLQHAPNLENRRGNRVPELDVLVHTHLPSSASAHVTSALASGGRLWSSWAGWAREWKGSCLGLLEESLLRQVHHIRDLFAHLNQLNLRVHLRLRADRAGCGQRPALGSGREVQRTRHVTTRRRLSAHTG